MGSHRRIWDGLPAEIEFCVFCSGDSNLVTFVNRSTDVEGDF